MLTRRASQLRKDLKSHLRPEYFRCLSDPVRLQVLSRLALARGSMTVTEVSGCCGVHLSGVSRHLAQLREIGLVDSRKEGREVRYTLRSRGLVDYLRNLADLLERCQESDCCKP